MLELRVRSGTDQGAGALVVFVGHDGALAELAANVDRDTQGLVSRLAGHEPEKRKQGRIQHVPLPAGLSYDHLLIAAVGKPEGLSRLDLEELGGTIAQHLGVLRVRTASLTGLEGLQLGVPALDALLCVSRGVALRSYRFDKYHQAAEDEEQGRGLEVLELITSGGQDEFAAKLDGVKHLVGAVNRARDLVSEPANVLGPAEFAEACKQLEPLGIEVKLLDAARLEELGMRALLGVSQGSSRPPFVVTMEWRGGGSSEPVALIGKGVCFDSGGISIKPAGGMEDMKWDMGGAAAVVGAMAAVATRKARANVVGVIGLVENMPSGTAQRPGDVVRAMSGKTIEVINTDAEGRLVLADALWYTKETFKPRVMIDLATLTGAIIVALGHEHAGLFANNDELARELTQAGEDVGERLWRMPLGKEYTKHIKSDIADIKNVGRARQAGATAGAVFLEQFVGSVPWAHLDVAGTVWSSRDLPLAGKGATGFGVRLLDRFVQAREEAPPG